ncbi:MAG: hypothetical protein IKU62_08755 [Ruminiclostridium sp.]|nr:hypothetical protein [Ruminiclostridium sp.]
MAYKLDTGNIFAKMTVAQIALGLSAPAVRRIEHGKRQDTVCREIFDKGALILCSAKAEHNGFSNIGMMPGNRAYA